MSRSKRRLVYTVSEAGELLGLGRSTAYDLAAQGVLPTVRLGRRLMVTRPALTALLGFEPLCPTSLTTPTAPSPPRPDDVYVKAGHSSPACPSPAEVTYAC